MAATPDLPPRIEPLPREEWGRTEIDALEPLTPPPDSAYARRREARGGAGGVNALALLLRNPALCKAFFQFNRHLLYESSLDDRLRELVVLRVAHLIDSPYEWAQHVPVALDCGMSAEEVDRVRVGADQGWSAFDAAALRATDQLLATGHIDDADWEVLSASLDQGQLLDLVFTVGGYATLGMAFNAARIPMDLDLEV